MGCDDQKKRCIQTIEQDVTTESIGRMNDVGHCQYRSFDTRYRDGTKESLQKRWAHPTELVWELKGRMEKFKHTKFEEMYTAVVVT